MADDPILISQIIYAMGLSGQEAEAKRQELQKLSNEELYKLGNELNGIGTKWQAAPGIVSWLTPVDASGNNGNGKIVLFSDTILNDDYLSLSSNSSNSQKPLPKEYTLKEKRNLDKFLGDYLLQSYTSGFNEIHTYNQNIGWANIPDRIVNGFKIFTGQTDRVDVENKMFDGMLDAQQLQRLAYASGDAFRTEYEKEFGIKYSFENIEELKNTSQEYIRVTAYHDKTELLKQGFEEVKSIIRQEKEYAQAIKHVRGPAAAYLRPPEKIYPKVPDVFLKEDVSKQSQKLQVLKSCFH